MGQVNVVLLVLGPFSIFSFRLQSYRAGVGGCYDDGQSLIYLNQVFKTLAVENNRLLKSHSYRCEP